MEKKIYLNVHTMEYIKNENKRIFIPKFMSTML